MKKIRDFFGLNQSFTKKNINNEHISVIQTLGQPVWSEKNYKSIACESFIKNVIAHRAISMIAQGAASVNLSAFRRNNGENIRLKDQSLPMILKRPNPSTSGKYMLEEIYYSRLISGNAFILAIKNESKLKELYVLRPDRVNIIPGNNMMPYGYRYNVDSEYKDYIVDQITGQSDILHIKNFHPLSDWYGLSSAEAAAYSIDQHNQAGVWNQALLQNGARPSGVLTLDKENSHLNNEDFVRLKNQIDEAFTGAHNSGRPIIMDYGMSWREVGITPRDMDFISAKHSSARDIALAFGVPPQLLGIPGDNTYSNFAEARIALWEQTILPLVDSTISSINHWLCSFYGDDLVLSYDTDSIPALSEQRYALWERISNANFMTRAEKRAMVSLPKEKAAPNATSQS